MFSHFEQVPVASASIAQVHFATLRDGRHGGREVAVKVLRPNMLPAIEKDLSLMRMMAGWVERLSADGKRLKPREVVGEFDKYLHDELDLVREASNAAQLRRNMQGLDLVLIPEMFWDYCHTEVMVMERMHGLPINQVDELRSSGVDIPKLARDGVTLFFTQVFRDGFFHADMHPGNIQVSVAPATFGRYISLDFGIVGTLTEFDKEYLAQNFTAFFRRDYKRVAELHIESGWVPAEHPGGRAGVGHPRGVRTLLRPAAEGNFARHGADAPVPDLAPLPGRDPAAAGACCRKPCSTSRVWGATSIPSWTCGTPPSRFSKNGWSSRSGRKSCCSSSRPRRRSTPSCCPRCRACSTTTCSTSRTNCGANSTACWPSSAAPTACCRPSCTAGWAFCWA